MAFRKERAALEVYREYLGTLKEISHRRRRIRCEIDVAAQTSGGGYKGCDGNLCPGTPLLHEDGPGEDAARDTSCSNFLSHSSEQRLRLRSPRYLRVLIGLKRCCFVMEAL
ncbi:Hypothetical predicted protein [Olea europaea subsp. europaea]|uniref:Uncharacterized protein n=1 Tax=Olea europaea subsp. europaea TaxID=158383 RepID=A0A8S0RV40_OLEEU|nr:Hypothetical predicted protein [Olea europaea subsp. europaea]